MILRINDEEGDSEPVILPGHIAILEHLKQSNAPAKDMPDADDYMSTYDLYEQLTIDNGPLSFDEAYLDDWLMKHYTHTMLGTSRVWLFKKQD